MHTVAERVGPRGERYRLFAPSVLVVRLEFHILAVRPWSAPEPPIGLW